MSSWRDAMAKRHGGHAEIASRGAPDSVAEGLRYPRSDGGGIATTRRNVLPGCGDGNRDAHVLNIGTNFSSLAQI